MRRVLHLFQVEKFTDGFMRFIRECFPVDNHFFWIYNNGVDYITEQKEYLFSNVLYLPRIEVQLRKEGIEDWMDAFDLILIHGLFSNHIIDFLYKNNLLKKTAIYFWGIPTNQNIFKNKKRQYVVRHARSLICIVQEDAQKIMEIYGFKRDFMIAEYYEYGYDEIMKEDRRINQDDNNAIRIQVGNSAFDVNEHYYCLDALSKFKDCDLEIILPLSYGDHVYGSRVKDYAKGIFGEKVRILDEFMSRKEYYDLMGTMDVMVYGAKVQHALGNIYATLLLGKKLYLREHSAIDSFLSNKGIVTHHIERIADMEFNEFYIQSKKEREENVYNVQMMLDKQKKVEAWRTIFETA